METDGYQLYFMCIVVNFASLGARSITNAHVAKMCQTILHASEMKFSSTAPHEDFCSAQVSQE